MISSYSRGIIRVWKQFTSMVISYQALGIILLFIQLFSIANAQHIDNYANQEYKSHEALIIHKDYYQLQFLYKDSQSHLPQSLFRLLEQISVKQLTLQMGFLNPTYIQETQSFSDSYSSFAPLNYSTVPIFNGVYIQMKNTSKITPNNYKSIAQIFSVSRSQQFMIYLDQVQQLYASNPNDKFCGQHLTNIIKTFLPCRTVSGIAALINQRNFFLQKMFAGIRLNWQIGKSIQIKFYLQKRDKYIKSYLKSSEQKRVSRMCKHFDNLYVLQQTEWKQLTQDFQKTRNKQIQHVFTSSQQVKFCSNYYNPIKHLELKLNLTRLKNEVGKLSLVNQISQVQGETQDSHFDLIDRINARILIPKGFVVKQVRQECQSIGNNCSSIIQSVKSQLIQINGQVDGEKDHKLANYLIQPSLINIRSSLVLVSVYLNKIESYQTESIDPQNDCQESISIIISYQSHLKPFQQYQTIAGGGEQFMNIPLIVELKSKKIFVVHSNSNSNMLDRLLQPDFSIPFHTITFTIAIFGYLWIAVWKAFWKQLNTCSKQQTATKEHTINQQKQKQYVINDNHQKKD